METTQARLNEPMCFIGAACRAMVRDYLQEQKPLKGSYIKKKKKKTLTPSMGDSSQRLENWNALQNLKAAQ